jgi:nucleoside recognition membrane protein YjiH
VITVMYLPSIQKTPASSMTTVMYLPSIQKTPASYMSSQLCTNYQYRRHQHPPCHQLCTYHQNRRHQHPLCHHSYVLTINTEDTSIICVITVMYLPSIQKTPASSVSSQLCTYHQYRRHQHPPCDHSYVLTINTEDTSILCVITVMYLPSIQKTPASSE